MRILILAALVAAPVPALAADGQGTARVSYADLDLSTRSGRTALDRRIGHAVRALCGSEGVRELTMQMSAAKCRRLTRETAELQRDQIVASYRRPVESAAR